MPFSPLRVRLHAPQTTSAEPKEYLASNNSDETVRTGASAGTDRSAHPPRIGSYRITRVLGEGGMGLVYEAEQLEPFRRTVALKVIRRGMDSRDVLARFESERQSLAVMDHPNIAKALDAGTTDDGLPYFVMELVAGVPITEYCDAERLDLRHRLELFVGRLQRRPARAPEGHHPPRPEAEQHPGPGDRREAGPHDHRLRDRPGGGARAARETSPPSWACWSARRPT